MGFTHETHRHKLLSGQNINVINSLRVYSIAFILIIFNSRMHNFWVFVYDFLYNSEFQALYLSNLEVTVACYFPPLSSQYSLHTKTVLCKGVFFSFICFLWQVFIIEVLV